jgi:tetratricopeptide (TPR) repeat protein
MKRRDRKKLEETVERAKTPHDKALAYYKLGLFHDNNAREAEAIPNYNKAIKLGLDRETNAKALAWLASSLYKTDEPQKALGKLKQSFSLTADPKLKQFLIGLKKRIKKVLK